MEDYDVLLIGGDMWDTPRIPYYVYARYVEILAPLIFANRHIFTVYGQHDLRYHTRKENTPIHALSESGLLHELSAEQYWDWPPQKVRLYGCSWEEEIPKVEDKSFFNILVIHRMITSGGPLFPGQEDYTPAATFLRSHDFNLVVSGDNHLSFTAEADGKFLINSGSMCRTKIDQVDHQPKLFVYSNGKVEEINIPIEDPTEVFDLDKYVQVEDIKSEVKKKITEFLSSLKDSPEHLGLNFVDNLEKVLKKHGEEVSHEIVELLYECMRESEVVE